MFCHSQYCEPFFVLYNIIHAIHNCLIVTFSGSSPSATKLQRLCFYTSLSFCPSGVPGPRGCLLWGGAWSRGCLVRGGGAWSWESTWSWGWVVPAPGVCGIPACTEADPPGRDGYCCGRDASYWNAFLFFMKKGFNVIRNSKL